MAHEALTGERCPHCQQPIRPPVIVRRCFDCDKPMARRDKWLWAYREGTLTSVHRYCSNPTEYRPLEITRP